MNNTKYYFTGTRLSDGTSVYWIVDDVNLTSFFNRPGTYLVGVNTEMRDVVMCPKSGLTIRHIKEVPSQINIWLDDERTAPNDWLHVRTAAECIAQIQLHGSSVQSMSLDHDLGDDELFGTGYEVITWLEEQAFNSNWDRIPPSITVHSQNNVAARRMSKGLESIANMAAKKYSTSQVKHLGTRLSIKA